MSHCRGVAALARPGATLLSSHTLKLAEGYVYVRALGAMPIKGVAEAIEVFELTGAGGARTRLQAAATRGLPHFVESRGLRLVLIGPRSRPDELFKTIPIAVYRC
jgi:hypothetical protein